MHTTKPNQCLLDIAVSAGGAVEAAWELALAGSLPLDWEPAPGEPFAVAVMKGEVVTYFRANNLEPASAIEQPAVAGGGGSGGGPEGVDYWIVQTDFIVS